jgi:protein transport protein SEC39
MRLTERSVTTFRPYFPTSVQFQQASSLIAATHALSFYSLTLQHGVPFKPVSIRVSQDPIGLIDKVLEQNPGSYTKLDDIVAIGRNLIAAGLPHKNDSTDTSSAESLETKKEDAERRVTLMCIEAALREDDFETAYSYIVSRLTPSAADIEAPANDEYSRRHRRNISKSSIRSGDGEPEDDISWRAAFLAGRYRGPISSPPSLRRLEQRTELLSLALLLAPVSALTEILTAWRRCEEEMTSMQMAQQQAEEDFDTWADKRQSMNSLPGNFTGDQPAMVLNQTRREMGRMTGTGRNESDAPVSMFDLTRTFRRNAFPLRSAARSSSGLEAAGMEDSTDSLGSDGGVDGQRVRKRDMVANAVSGGLASGIGWMLGATPVAQQQPRDEQ